ncbi:MAG: hypothetical protein A3D10_01700 [Omnitrophica WOR_2 bacterium RIFCSPHIGHO2_02_FULL_48_11]|nr:MAG: hypothetical protein A3D10_01700 [Omnitrophica WOR_2 bacterium RIFCSPHIGHO2_02_FULL_48_11]
MIFLKTTACGAIFFICAGCATLNVAKVGDSAYRAEDDEQNIAKEMDKVTELLDESGYIYQNKELEEYVNRLTDSLLSDEIKASGVKISVKILSDTSLNAVTYANNRIYLNTGMLAAMDNEAQLAALLSHEMVHAINRHALKKFRSAVNKSAFLSVAVMPAAVAGGALGSVFTRMTVLSSVAGYSQQLEYEADNEGLKMMVQSGYAAKEAPQLFVHLKEFIQEEEGKEPLFFSSHPHVISRIKNYETIIEKDYAGHSGTKMDSAEFDRLTNQLVLDNARLCLQSGLFKTGERNIQKFIGKNAADPQGYFYRGELFRQRQDHPKQEKVRDKKEDYLTSLEAYNKAIALNVGYAPAYKGKAQVLEKQGVPNEAKENYRKYLELAPGAGDRGYIEQFLNS